MQSFDTVKDELQREEPDLRRWGRMVWRRKWLLAGVIVLIPLAVFVGSSLLSKTYESSTTLYVQPTSVSSTLFSNQLSIATSDVQEAATLIETTVVARRAARVLGQNPSTAPQLLDHVDVEAVSATDIQNHFLRITARASSPTRAAGIANAFAAAVATTRSSDAIGGIDRTIATLESQADGGVDRAARQALAQQLQDLRGLRASQRGTTPVVEPALPAEDPVSPKPLRNAGIALFLALLIAAGLAPLLDRLDRRLQEPDELEELVAAPLLAMVPADAFSGGVPSPQVRESFQTLRAALTYFNVDRSLPSVMVTSAAPLDGKTTVATNLALALAQDERDIILLDGDLRRPQVATRLGCDDGPGLDAVLAGERSLEEALTTVDSGDGRLRVLPAGPPPPNPAVLLGSRRMRSLLAELCEQADLVVVDTPAMLAVSDAIPLLEQVAGTILVARMGRTTRESLRRTSQVISAAGGAVVGVVATGARAGGLYGYDEDAYYYETSSS